MAYAALTYLAGVILQILPQEQRYVSLCSKEKMNSLHEKVGLLQDFLEYISLKSLLPDIVVLESRIRDTAYKMEDTIELTILTKREPERLITSFAWCFKDFHVLLEEAMDMKKVIDNNTIPKSIHPLITTTSLREATGSKGTKVGLEKALNQILDRVTRQGSMLMIVPIIGMGGIGKTTLARATYQAPHTLHHFDVRRWVTVSQDYNIQHILRALLPKTEEQDDERLIEYVHKHLKGRRYLIVLDDMWDEKVWDRVRNALPDDNNGSRVILTTRLSKVASYIGSSSPVHKMQFLNEDQSWDLLREHVHGHERCSTEYEDIGRMIAKNCKGLPLAVVVIAGLLKFNKTRDYWEQVARNTGKVSTTNDPLFEILSWSYTRLPPHLKACFLYLGAYKEDHEIKTKELVRLWASEGFLKPKQSRSIEEVAEECLEELVARSLVLVTTKRYNGKIRTCNVHDVVREVSIRKAEEEKFLYHFTLSTKDEMSVFADRRRVSFITDFIIDPFLGGTYIATRSFLHEEFIYHFGFMHFIHCFKLLRVLSRVHLYRSGLSTLCKLTNLRYLHIVCECNLQVPESISELQNLEVLIIGASSPISFVFPMEIWKLQRLRHIVTTGESRLQLPVPDQRLVLCNLQTLYWVMNIDFTTSFAERIPNLKKLKLKLKLKYQYDGKEHTMENLQYLHILEELSIRCDGFRPTNFVFPQNLTKLCLYRTKIPVKNLSPIGLLPNLKVLKLKFDSVEGEEWEPIEGEFLQLEHLKMEDLHISNWIAESIHFPHLRKLVILNCHRLEEIPESIGEMDTLETLIVKVYREEAKISAQKIQENQREMGNDLLQVIVLDYYRY